MSKSKRSVIYRRGAEDESNESDIWDDTALIKAYDYAVNAFKDQMLKKDTPVVERSESDSARPKQGRKNQHQQKKNKKSKKNKKKKKSPLWRIGDKCMAPFTVDGNMYEALIVELDSDAETCTIRFTGYGNEEEVSLNELMTYKQPQANKRDSLENGYDSQASSGMEWFENSSSHMQSRHHRPEAATRSQRFIPQHQRRHPFPFSPFLTPPPFYWPPPGPMMRPTVPPGLGHSSETSFPFPFSLSMPNIVPPYSPGHPNAHPLSSTGSVPTMPPPPPPPSEDHLAGSDSEALSSMLISWYMSGYHTGYYLGLKKANQGSLPCQDKKEHGKLVEESLKEHSDHAAKRTSDKLVSEAQLANTVSYQDANLISSHSVPE